MTEEYSCFICNKKLSRKQALLYHLEAEKRKKHTPDVFTEIDERMKELRQRVIRIAESIECQFCQKIFKSKYSAHRHQLSCSLNPKCQLIVSDEEEKKSEESKQEYKPKTITQQYGEQQFQLNQQITQKYSKNKVKVLLAEDYLPILEEKLGSKEAVYQYLKSCMYRKQAGDLDIFNKIHMEGRSPNYYPVKCLDRKTLRFASVNKEGRLVEGTNFSMRYISGNIQDCYIQIQNEAILNHCKKGESGHDFLFNQHDVGGWQEHLVEYGDSKYQLELLKGLANMLFDEIQEYSQSGGLYIDTGLNYQFALDELEMPVKPSK